MLLPGSETTVLFEAKNQMAIPNALMVKLVNDGIFKVPDLFYFDKDILHQITDNICSPLGKCPEPNFISLVSLAVPLPSVPTIPTPTFIFGAKYQKHFLVACDIIRFFGTIGRNVAGFQK